MIMIFGGTTEGRNALSVCDEAGKVYYYSTKSNYQKIESLNGIHIKGDLNKDKIIEFIKEKRIKLIVDAAHPFAEILHQNIAYASDELDIPVIRLERVYQNRDNDLIWFDSYNDAVNYLLKNNINNLLALTGVNTISKLKPYWTKYNCWFRILDRGESHKIAYNEGFPNSNIIYFDQEYSEESVFQHISPSAIITKESGDSGGFIEKVLAARKLNIPVLVIKRPTLSSKFINVYGEHGLRKQIEHLLPDFFQLKTGYTTGTCATAAVKASLIVLVTGELVQSVDISLPNGEIVTIPIEWIKVEMGEVTSAVKKIAGDDPDVTNGIEVLATVSLNTLTKHIRFLQGEGVGVVTLPGLGLEIGSPAINETPRKMMINEILYVLSAYNKLDNGKLICGVDVTISIPNGEKIAQKTLNSKVGIIGGISIIGTSGVVKPYSNEAFIKSIHREMQVAKALHCSHIVFCSGNKSEKYVKELYHDFSNQAFIHYGNFIGDAIKIASDLSFKNLTLAVMVGKAVKLAEGALNTHSKKNTMNIPFLIQIAKNALCSDQTIHNIYNIRLARQLWDVVPKNEYIFFDLLLKKCYETCLTLFVKGNLEIFIVSENGEVIKT